MNKIEDYINQLNTDGIRPADDQPADIIGDAIKQLSARDATIDINVNIGDELRTYYGVPFPTVEDPTRATPAMRQIALDQMKAAIVNYNPIWSSYIDHLRSDITEAAYIELIRKSYGDALVEAAFDDARKSGRTLYHCIQLRLLAERLNQSLGGLSKVFEALANSIAAGLANIGQAMAEAQGNAPANRHDRRRAKHGSRSMKESDQQWRRRDRTKRNNRQ